MALRIRRGSNEQRLPITFEPGELIWVNQAATGTPYKLYVGNAGTPGGIDILQSSVGNKLRYNTVNGKIDLDLTSGNRLNTDDIIQLGGATNKFFTNELAQDAVGAMFAAGTMSGITFVYDDVGNKMNVTVTGGGGGGGAGITALIDDPSPTLGGTFHLNSHNITGIGSIDITGSATLTGTLTAPAGIGSNLPLNGFNINGAGNITIGGNANFVGTLTSQTGLGANLSLNGHNLTGLGDINVSGLLSVNGLGSNLSLNGYNLTGSGDINTSGSLSVNGLGANLDLNGHNIIGTGNINISGDQHHLDGPVLITGDQAVRGSILVGTSADPHAITINTSSISGLNINGISNLDDNGPSTSFYASRGTIDNPQVCQLNDQAGSIFFKSFVTVPSILGLAPQYAPLAVIQTNIDKITNGTSTFTTAKIQLGVFGSNTQTAYASLDSLGRFNSPVLQTTVYSVAGIALPAAGSAGIGARAFVSDATASTFATAYIGGGSNKVPVYSDGSSWYIG